MKYLLIDTNILIQCCLLELEKGDDLNVLRQLNQLLEEGKLVILLPEVVELEFYRSLDKKTQKLRQHIGGYKEEINKDSDLDERVRKDMIEKIGECFEERKKNTEEVKKEIEKIFKSKKTIKLPITPVILVNSIRTSLSGSKPYSEEVKNNIQSDVLILESVKDHLSGKTGYCLYLCSQNTADFAKNPKDNQVKMEVADSVKIGFEKLEYYTNLLQLLNDVFKTKFTKESIKDFDKKARNKVIIRIPSDCGPRIIEEISQLLKTYKIGSRKVAVSIQGATIETTFSIDDSDVTLNDLSIKVAEVIRKNKIVEEAPF